MALILTEVQKKKKNADSSCRWPHVLIFFFFVFNVMNLCVYEQFSLYVAKKSKGKTY